MNSHAVIALLSDKGIHLHLCYRPYTILKKLLTSVYNLTIMQVLKTSLSLNFTPEEPIILPITKFHNLTFKFFRLNSYLTRRLLYAKSYSNEAKCEKWHLKSDRLIPSYLWTVRQRHLIYVRSEVRNQRAARNVIALIKLEGIFKHVLTKPHAREGVKQAFVEVVCDATTVLNFTKHVMYRDPRHTLRGGRKEKRLISNMVCIMKPLFAYLNNYTVCSRKRVFEKSMVKNNEACSPGAKGGPLSEEVLHCSTSIWKRLRVLILKAA